MEGKENIVITDKVFEEYKTNHFNRQRDLKINFFFFFGSMMLYVMGLYPQWRESMGDNVTACLSSSKMLLQIHSTT